MRLLMISFYLLLILIGITFAILNPVAVQVNLYIATLILPISVLMISTLGIGILLGFFLFLSKYWRIKVELYKIKNQLRLTEKEIKNLRNIPLHDHP